MKLVKERKNIFAAYKQYSISLLKITFSAILIFLLINNIGLDHLGQQIKQVAWQGIVLSLIVYIVSNILGALQWFMLLHAKKMPISFLQALSYYHVGLFFNNFLIGNVGGDAMRVIDVRRRVGKEKGALATVFFDRFLGFFAMSSLALLMTMIMARRLVLSSAVFFILAVFIIWMVAILFLFNKQFARKFAWVFKLLLPTSLHVKAKAFYDSINEFRTKKKLLGQIFLLSLLVQTLRIMTHFWAGRAMGVQAKLLYFFLFIPVVALVTSMPISLGGIGVREQSAVALFSQIHIPTAQTVAFEFLAYLIGIIATIPGGIIFALRREHVYKNE